MSIETWLEQYGAEESLNEYGEPVEAQEEAEPEVEDEQPEEDDDLQSDASDDVEDEQAYEEEPQKPVQSKEQNSYYAERRRQEQIEKAVQEKLRLTREYQTSQLIAEMYGVPQEELYDRLYEAKLEREAESQNVPVEYLREREQLRQQQSQLQDQLNNLMFQQWQARVENEKANLKSQLTMLTQDDLDQAAYYMLNDLKRTDLPLEQAVFALHGSKILNGLKNTAKNEALAEVSGRKKSPLPVKGGRSQNDSVSLSDEERYIAKKLGLTDKEYSKWKEGN